MKLKERILPQIPRLIIPLPLPLPLGPANCREENCASKLRSLGCGTAQLISLTSVIGLTQLHVVNARSLKLEQQDAQKEGRKEDTCKYQA